MFKARNGQIIPYARQAAEEAKVGSGNQAESSSLAKLDQTMIDEK